MTEEFTDLWTRRRFMAGAAAAGLALRAPGMLGQPQDGVVPRSAASSPEEITGAVRGLMKGATARPLRYRPVDGGFVIEGGKEFFNRPLYGPNTAFRVDAGDLPEFSLYMPGHGGNLRLGVASERGAKWLFEAAQVRSEYRAGQMRYSVRDTLLGEGEVVVELVTLGAGAGLHVRVLAKDVSDGVRLVWGFGGASGRKGKRGGDIGCESEPVAQFFQVRPDECRGDVYEVSGASARLKSNAVNLEMVFPQGTTLGVGDARRWNAGCLPLQQSAGQANGLPVLVGSVAMVSGRELHMVIRREAEEQAALPDDLASVFAGRTAQLEKLAATLAVATPDEFVNAMGAALPIAGDALWDDAQRCVMHGAVAWRQPLAGWRGPYVLDALGWHERFREHARHWIAKQNTSAVTTGSPAEGTPDAGSHLSRSENLLHSRGDISHNHYDMNLVFFDAVLRHLGWTGDVAFAREIWPALVMHLEWERRMFRRVYREGGEALPLYEGYACIWASDNLQYNGGGAAHSSAYKFYANRAAAEMARLIGEDGKEYEREAALILEGMRRLLWIKEQGTFGESKDLLGPETVYASPALWSVYHTIDSEVATPREAWLMAAERLGSLRRIPVEGEGVPAGGYLLSCSDWMPYVWSLNLLLLAENMHMALALWQAGMAEEAFGLFKGNVVDSMFQGLTPGNFHMTSQLDAHRQEAQRDFGDPIGIASRALVEGLFGVRPKMLAGRLVIEPGFPRRWDRASLRHADFDLAWRREGRSERLEVASRFTAPLKLELRLRALWIGMPRVTVNGVPIQAKFDAEAVGTPVMVIEVAAAAVWSVEIEWMGEAAAAIPERAIYAAGDRLRLPPGVAMDSIDDPQGCLRDGRVSAAGPHTVFAKRRAGECEWWTPISFEVAKPTTVAAGRAVTGKVEHVNLAGAMTGKITEIFRRSYDAPRSPYCSLAIPEQGVGAWAAFDTQPKIDDAGLRMAGGVLRTPFGATFATPSDASTSNCVFLSCWRQDRPAVKVPLAGKARRIFLLMAGSTFPQCSRMTHAVVRVRYDDGSASQMELRNPETWWPIEQDYLIDDYLFVNDAPIPTRVDLKTGKVRVLDRESFKGRGRAVEGGAASVFEMELAEQKQLAELEVEVKLYGVVVALMAASLER
jgi:Domain of unknown function (DUF4450)